MKIRLDCPTCRHWSKTNPHKEYIPSLITISNTEKNVSRVDCHKHYNIVYFTNYKYDLLFESGLKAINDKYYREAVANFAASLERFYEYILQIITFELDDDLKKSSWKYISNQSERQLGAYYYLFLKEFKIQPITLSNKMIEFRNKVIHKGFFPDEFEVYNYLKETLNVINQNIAIILELKNNAIEKYHIQFVENIRKEALDELEKYTYEISKNKEIVAKELKSKNITELTVPIYLGKVVQRIFERNIPTFLYNKGIFQMRSEEDIGIYIKKLEYNTID
ncbi:hypothetical protein [Empedobacter tilapiae]|uniref:hypothetical protein n=1 Tax=Empedobacter tilapiae TaxID=2491114 RepID=UPI0028D100D0|nr:hypothetical protein [Empedobacter tilapiae]